MFFKTVDFISRCFFKILILIDAIVFHTYICYDNGKKLFTLLIRGTRTWVIMLFRLVMFTLMLAPGWFKLLRYWFLSPLIIRNLRYGKGAKNRNLLDVYLPVPQKRSKHKDSAGGDFNYNNSYSRKNGAPVVVFVSGGAWTIGYKLWSALVARGLAKLGILTIVPDYRNFPQGDVEDMMEDIRLAVEWTSINAHRFGGDANKIVLSGQSAGAHITLCLLVSDFLEKKFNEQDKKNKTGRETIRSHAERYLTNTDDSGSIFEEDDSEADYSDYESDISEEELQPEAVGTPIPGAPVGDADAVTEDQETDLGQPAELAAALDGEAEISPLTVEYMTPLRSSSHTHTKLPKSPRGSLHASGGTEEVRHSSSRRSRRVSSLRNVHSETVDDGQGNTPSKHHHSGSRKKRSYSSDQIQPQTRPASGSIIDMIDTYLGANISSNNHRSTSSKIISNTASSLKKKFREQVRRNSDAMDYEPDRFFPSEETSSSSEGPGPEEGAWREVDSVRKSARRHSPRTMAFLNRSQGTPINASHAPFSPLARFPRVEEETDPAVSGLEALAVPDAVAATPAVQQRILSTTGMKRTRKTKRKFCVASNIKLFIGVSGPYNLEALESHLHQRGMDSRILNWICRGSIGNYSPTTQLAEYAKQLLAQQHEELNASHSGDAVAPQVYSVSQPSNALADLTPIALFHGSRDATIPVSICTDLSNVLHTHGANALCKIYEGWSHTDAILEAPLSGTMRLFHDMAGVIFAHTAECSSNLGSANNIAGLPVAADRLVIPPNPNAQEPDDYICSPLDYLSLTLFPKLFATGTAAPSAVATERVPVPGSANTSISGDETRKHAPPASPGTESQHSHTSHLTDRARRKHLERERKRKASKVASSNDPMVSQLLVKMAREINPF